MLSEERRQAAARQLLAAEQDRRPMARLSDSHPEMDVEDAYDVQRRVIAMKVESGARVRGYKIGLTSKAMQSAAGISEPDFGHLLDDMFHADGDCISVAPFQALRVEVELAFILNRPLKGPGVTVSDVLSATEHVVPALELIDSRTELPRNFVDTLSDNAASAGVVIGGRPVRPMDLDLRWIGAVVYKNAVIEDSGVAAAVLGHPAAGVAWLANRFGSRGVCLEPGQVLLGGSFTRPLAVAAGDVFHVDYGPLGGIAVAFTE
ncbi:2-oxo-hept-4-ene-1,7-dioate hydratase [Piscinibacter sakaiensis]|uniref:2-oxo-hept-4-ene-1,7-dioate hydratase n=1 Tax=Piscinibacter sakaiensis TaxID=1547922 RepID=UPI003AB06C7C